MADTKQFFTSVKMAEAPRNQSYIEKMINIKDVFTNEDPEEFQMCPARPEGEPVRRILIMRHGERVDFTFGKWVPHCFDKDGNYIRKDLNMPKTVPKRHDGPEGFVRDTPLTNIGRYQAKLVGEGARLNGITIEHVYASPALRCMQTCDGFLKGMGIKDKVSIRIEPALFEWIGWYVNGPPTYMKPEDYVAAGFNIDLNYTPLITTADILKAETVKGYYERSARLVKRILDQHPCGDILLVGHGSTLDVCSRDLMNCEVRDQDKLLDIVSNVPYCSLVEVAFDGKNWSFQKTFPPVTHTTNERFNWKVLKS